MLAHIQCTGVEACHSDRPLTSSSCAARLKGHTHLRTGLYLTRPPPVVIRFTFGATLGYCAHKGTLVDKVFAL